MTVTESTRDGPDRSPLPVRPLEWIADHGERYRIFRAESGVGRFAYGTDANGIAWHQGPLANADHADERTAREAAESAHSALVQTKAADLGLLVDEIVRRPEVGSAHREPEANGFERWLSSPGNADLYVLHGPTGFARIAWNAALENGMRTTGQDVAEAFLRLCDELGIPATTGAHLEYRKKTRTTPAGDPDAR